MVEKSNMMANRLRQVRRAHPDNITHQKLATAIGVSRQTIINIEKGHTKRPADEIMLAIASFFNMKVDDIFFTPLVRHVGQCKARVSNKKKEM